uniref:Uncharacterized protein n=1 Tax=Rhizophora mucronata TaxID=61149 RepID=A0A2P2QVY0_RHIMU
MVEIPKEFPNSTMKLFLSKLFAQATFVN